MRALIIIFFIIVSQSLISQVIESDLGKMSNYIVDYSLAQKEVQNSIKDNIKDSGDENSSSIVSLLPKSMTFSSANKQLDVRNSYEIALNGNDNIALNIGLGVGGKIDNSIASIFANNDVVGGYKIGGNISFRYRSEDNLNDKRYIDLLKRYNNEKDKVKKEDQRKRLIKYASSKISTNTWWFYIAPSFEGRKFTSVVGLNSNDLLKQNGTLSSYRVGIMRTDDDLLNTKGFFDLSYKYTRTDNFASLTEGQAIIENKTVDRNGNTLTNRQSLTTYIGLYNPDVNHSEISLTSYIVSKNFPSIGLHINPVYSFVHTLYENTLDLNYTVYFFKPYESIYSPSYGLTFSNKDLLGNRDELYGENKSRFSIGIITSINLATIF